MEKAIQIDEKAVYRDVLAALDDHYELVYVDYRDELPAGLVQQCLKKKDITPLTEEDVYADERTAAAQCILDELLKEQGLDADQAALFRMSEEYDELRFAIEERDRSCPLKDLVTRSDIHGYVFFGSNYDCHIDIFNQGGLWYADTAMAGLLSVLSLNPRKVKDEALRQGVAVHGRWPDLRSREGKEVVKYNQFVECLRETPNYGNWCFFGVFDGEALWNNRFDTDGMTITKGTTCAMFNSWDGGGSLAFCETLRDLPLSEVRRKQSRYSDTYRVLVDETGVKQNGYTPHDVYGDRLSDDVFLS